MAVWARRGACFSARWRERLSRPARPSLRENALIYALWLLGLVGAALLFRNTLHSHLANRDFAAFWIAGKLAAGGQAAQAFSVSGNEPVAKAIGRIIESIFLYPPHALFFAVPVSYVPLRIAFWAWNALTAVLFYLAARAHLPPNFPKVLTILTPAALISAGFGQVGLFFGALWLFAFSGSGVAAALLTFKPHLGILVAVEMWRRKQLVMTTAIAAAIIGLSFVVFGPNAWRSWFSEALAVQLGDLTPRNYATWLNKMTTPYIGYGLIGWLAFATAACWLLYRAFDVFTAATASFLIAPYGFHYDMTVVCLGFGVLLFQQWRRLPAWQTFVAALAFLSPLLVGLGTWVIPPILLAGLYVQTRNPLCGKEAAAKSDGPRQGLWGTLRQRQTFT